MKKKNRKIILNIGLPASGKSYWSKEFIRKNEGWVRVSRDDFRFMLADSPQLDIKGEKMVTDMVINAVKKAVSSGYDVIVDNSHCKLSHLQEAIDSLKYSGDIEFRYFDCSLKLCIERDSQRDKKVGEHIIKEMFDELKKTLDSLDFQTIKMVKPKDYEKAFDKNLPLAIITDIDGTVAHMNDKRGPFDFEKVGLDDPDYPVIESLKAWKAYKPDIKIIVVSGRDEKSREKTIEWMNAAEIPFDDLYMRPDNDFRKDSIIKKEIYEAEIKDKFNVVAVFDDRNQVVEFWRNSGLKCFQVEYGDF